MGLTLKVVVIFFICGSCMVENLIDNWASLLYSEQKLNNIILNTKKKH